MLALGWVASGVQTTSSTWSPIWTWLISTSFQDPRLLHRCFSPTLTIQEIDRHQHRPAHTLGGSCSSVSCHHHSAPMHFANISSRPRDFIGGHPWFIRWWYLQPFPNHPYSSMDFSREIYIYPSYIIMYDISTMGYPFRKFVNVVFFDNKCLAVDVAGKSAGPQHSWALQRMPSKVL